MKKILGISLVAVLAVSPLMAHAEGELAQAKTIASDVAETGTALTEQSYVKGAYNAALAEVRKVNNAVSTLNGNVEQTGSVLKAVKDNGATATYDSTQTYAADTIGGAIQSAINTSATTAGAGLTKSQQGAFSVNVDDSTIQVNNQDKLEVVAGSITTTQLDSGVVTSLGLADSAVQSVTEGNTAGAIEVDGQSVAVHGLARVATSGNASDLTDDATHRFVTDTNISNWNSAANSVANYSADLAAKQDVADSTVAAEQATAHTALLNPGNGVGANLVKLATGIETVDGTEIPVATGWANNNGADTTSTVTIGSLRN